MLPCGWYHNRESGNDLPTNTHSNESFRYEFWYRYPLDDRS
jgi:hypothetical protein